jgi:hypothetical protein
MCISSFDRVRRSEFVIADSYSSWTMHNKKLFVVYFVKGVLKYKSWILIRCMFQVIYYIFCFAARNVIELNQFR